jgi:hypothetical protein
VTEHARSASSSAHGHGDAVGSIGEEATKLVETICDWARRTFSEASAAHIATGSPECEWCPLCQVVAVMRGERPEATEMLRTAGSAVIGALRAVLDAAPVTGGPAEPAAYRVQRIDLGGG